MELIVKTEKSCKQCGITNKTTELYYCPKHKNIFCLNCMTKGQKALRFSDAVHCKNKYILGEFFGKRLYSIDDDCIYHKIPIIEQKEVGK